MQRVTQLADGVGSSLSHLSPSLALAFDVVTMQQHVDRWQHALPDSPRVPSRSAVPAPAVVRALDAIHRHTRAPKRGSHSPTPASSKVCVRGRDADVVMQAAVLLSPRPTPHQLPARVLVFTFRPYLVRDGVVFAVHLGAVGLMCAPLWRWCGHPMASSRQLASCNKSCSQHLLQMHCRSNGPGLSDLRWMPLQQLGWSTCPEGLVSTDRVLGRLCCPAESNNVWPSPELCAYWSHKLSCCCLFVCVMIHAT